MSTATVKLEDVLRYPSGLRRAGRVTTAHGHVAAFYREILLPPAVESIVARIARAVSPFDLEMCLRDAALFAPRASGKTKAGWVRAAEARLNTLQGTV